MQALWSDYGDITEQLYSPGDEGYDPEHPENNYRTIVQLHGGEEGPGAWLDNWHDVVVQEATWIPLQAQSFNYDKVNWLDTAYNSPYQCWPQPVTPPETWPFYKIRPGCHAYTQVSVTAELSPLFEKATTWRLDRPMFFSPYEIFNTGQGYRDYDRYPNNTVIIALECGYCKTAKTADGAEAGTVDWKYNYMHFLVPPLDVPLNNLRNSTYDLEPYGQNLVTLCPTNPPSTEHILRWINMHIYNLGELTLYCPGISLWVES